MSIPFQVLSFKLENLKQILQNQGKHTIVQFYRPWHDNQVIDKAHFLLKCAFWNIQYNFIKDY